jgi:hypothetical protein
MAAGNRARTVVALGGSPTKKRRKWWKKQLFNCGKMADKTRLTMGYGDETTIDDGGKPNCVFSKVEKNKKSSSGLVVSTPKICVNLDHHPSSSIIIHHHPSYNVLEAIGSTILKFYQFIGYINHQRWKKASLKPQTGHSMSYKVAHQIYQTEMMIIHY